jgi:hypothetical protein
MHAGSSGVDDREDEKKCRRMRGKIRRVAVSGPRERISWEIYGERQLAAELLRRGKRGRAEHAPIPLHIASADDGYQQVLDGIDSLRSEPLEWKIHAAGRGCIRIVTGTEKIEDKCGGIRWIRD